MGLGFYMMNQETPERIYGADSIVLLFDKQRVQAYYGFIPNNISLTFFGDYKSGKCLFAAFIS